MYMKQVVFFLLSVWMLSSCKKQVVNKYQIAGQTMGTTYHITYYGSIKPSKIKKTVDSLMTVLNAEVSTYIPSATISLFNSSNQDTVIIPRRSHFFWDNFAKAKEIYSQTDGYFDPTVMPLVNYWGFGYTGHRPVDPVQWSGVDSMVVDSLLQMVGFDKLLVHGDTIFRLAPNVQLDFSALAKGYGVDLVANWFDENGIDSYFIEIGGEDRAKGRKADDSLWSVGISVPKEHTAQNAYHTIIELNNEAMATSGNYRNFYEVKGQKFSHTISPKTGFSERNSLLSASVIAKDCMSADALATAMMAMGYDKAMALQKALGVEVILKLGLPDGSIKTKFSNKKRNITPN